MTELAEINSDLFDEVHRLKAELRIKSEFISTRQCPDHSGKWPRGRCLQCEIETCSAENKRLELFRSQWNDATNAAIQDINKLTNEVSNLKLANEEARKTIDRLSEMLPHEANSGGP